MNNYKDELKRITKILLKPEDDYGELTKAIDDLNELFFSVSELEIDKTENTEHINLPNGKAIGPVWAAFCVKEMIRTKRFIRGFYLGIKNALERFPNRPIHILYAGTGPFATLAMPLTTIFTSEEINFTLLEINPRSILSVEKVVSAFGAEKYINEIVKCDACEYKAEQKKPIHMIITETMLNALQEEPQVGITLNLVPQMVEGGILVPQNIIIEAVLLHPKKNMERITSLTGLEQDCYRVLGKIFELNKHTQAHPVTITSTNARSYSFPEIEVAVPKSALEEGYKHLFLFTKIQVFALEYIHYWECSLTLPQNLMILEQNNSIDKISFQYVLDKKPGFAYKVIATP